MRYLNAKEKRFLNLDPKSKVPWNGPITGFHTKSKKRKKAAK